MQIAFGRVRRKTSPAKKGRIYTKYCKVYNLGAIGTRTYQTGDGGEVRKPRQRGSGGITSSITITSTPKSQTLTVDVLHAVPPPLPPVFQHARR
jgi:hypothetical protein